MYLESYFAWSTYEVGPTYLGPKELNFVHIQFAISNKFMQINETT